MSRVRVTLLSLLAVLAFGAVEAGVASAAGGPTWRIEGEELKVAKKITATSGISRLWAPAIGVVIVCKKDKGTGEIENNSAKEGVDKKVVVTFEECSAWLTTTETSAHQVIQKEKLCEVANIKTEPLKSKLAYVPYSYAKEVVDVFEPEEAGKPFAVITLPEACKTLAGKYEVKGSVIGKIPRNQVTLSNEFTEEAVMQALLFETTNEPEGKTVEQKYSHWQLRARPVGNQEKDILTFGANPAAFESMEQVELAENAVVPLGPEPFGVHS